MKLRLGVSLRVSQALELRQTLEMKLCQSLLIVQKLRLELKLYKEREKTLTDLYRKALSRGMVRLYEKHGLKFEYAVVPQKEVPEKLRGLLAFSHCLYDGFEALLLGKKYALSRGSWLLFVVHDLFSNVRENYLEYGAVHERGEQVTLGDHNLASKLEFAIAKKEKGLLEYMSWIEENYPAKFADIFSYQVHLELPDAAEFQEVLELSTSTEEATRVREMIETFEWPYGLLQKLSLYQKRNEEAINIVSQTLRTAEILAGERGIPLKELVARIRTEVERGLQLIISSGLKRYISFPRLDAFWRELRGIVDNKFVEMLYAKRQVNPNYLEELIEARIEKGLPQDGVLSPSFSEALQAL